MNAWMAFVSIIAIIAIVLVAGGIIAFLGHMIIGAFDGDKKTVKDVVEYPEIKQLSESTEDAKDYNFEAINYAKAEQEQELADKEDVDFDEQFKLLEEEDDLEEIEDSLKEEPVSDEVADLSNEENKEKVSEELDDDFDDLDDLLDEISNDIVDEEKEKIQEENTPKMSDELSAYNIDEILNSEEETEESYEMISEESNSAEQEEVSVDETVEDIETAEAVDVELVVEDVADMETVAEETVETSEDTEGEDEEGDESQEVEIDLAPVEEISEDLTEEVDNEDKKVIEDLKAQLAELNKQLELARTQKAEVVTIDMTEEECLERLATLEERLKGVKKEYKINMKEYRPLKKVMTDLEKYQTKLRRKDAQVAKKKVALYGVNNYVDIDKEKAEKLANELDLLDGLRLSVSHCEEVINANKDRFPILEHTNKILEDQIAHIEADIETTNLTLQKIREKQGKDGENN